ncbi:MAG TPA: hypothetical protein VL122_12580 [Nitrospirota bacterium]|nr:hypothetical protein [Nitrospirota bacterium]
MDLQFKGNGWLLLKNVFFYVLAMAPLLSLCLMGSAWIHVFLTIIALSFIMLPVLTSLIARTDGFSFDDDGQVITGPVGKPVPYSAIKRMELNETAGLLQVHVKCGTFNRIALASALDRNTKARLVEELMKRIPRLVVRERPYADWKSVLLIASLLILATAGFHGFWYTRHPQVGIVPQKFEVTRDGGATSKANNFIVGDFSFCLPDKFRELGIEGDVTFIEDREVKRTEINVVAKSIAPSPVRRKFFRHTTGMSDYADMLEYSYNARFGIVPLVLKNIALAGMNDIEIFTVGEQAIGGFITQGSKKGRELTHILLVGGKERKEINFFMSGPSRLDEQELHELLDSIQLKQGGE